jgi:3-oxoacyl-ACP reductase-like protein
MGESRGVYRVLVGKSECKGPLGGTRCRWENTVKIDLQEVGCAAMGWIDLVQDRDRWRTLVKAVMNIRVA